MSHHHKHFYEFGTFRLDPTERRLHSNGKVLSLTPKAFDVLLLLVVNSDHVLRKEEFLEKVWAGSYVEEKNLADNISLLRKVLGDDSKAPSFIETVPRLGYRFVADVREVEEDGADVWLAEKSRERVVIEEDIQQLPKLPTNGIPALALSVQRRRISSPALIILIGAGLIVVSYVLLKNRASTVAQPQQFKSLIINVRIGITLYYSRRYDEAIEQLLKTLEFNPEFTLTHIFLYGSLYDKGMHREAIPHIVRGFFTSYSAEEKTGLEAGLKAVYEAAGDRGLWEKVRDTLKSNPKRDYNYPYTMAETSMRLSDRDEAFLWLQRTVDIRHPGVAELKVAPAMDVLRSDPRFAELLRRVNLP